jgi:hypothetical protein
MARSDSAVTLAGAAVLAHMLVRQENPFYMPRADCLEIEAGRFTERHRRDTNRECSLCRG